MASKKYKNKLCAYCGRTDRPTEREHVLAREFVLEGAPVKEWPSAPACRPCNADKADLERYVTAAAQIGGHHQDALANLIANGARRWPRTQRSLGTSTCARPAPESIQRPLGPVWGCGFRLDPPREPL